MSAFHNNFLPRDFVETAPGLLFALVVPGVQDQRALGMLRYVRDQQKIRKLDTRAAHELVDRVFPAGRYHCPHRDVLLHGVPTDDIVTHFRPAERLVEILASGGRDFLEERVVQAAGILGLPGNDPAQAGVTGSLLIDAHGPDSDIDLIIYDADIFSRSRERLRRALAEGQAQSLGDSDWIEAYQRRGCSLTCDEYVWHERRKLNKFMLGRTKVDISWVSRESHEVFGSRRKLSRQVIRAEVVDDGDVFAYPARYGVAHPEITQVVTFNPTYTGQAFVGEWIEAAGWVELSSGGVCQLLVGTSREAPGEYIRVVDCG
jgi:predicted nucleotidyltransferase